MTTRRLTLTLGAVALLVGLIALLVPVPTTNGSGGKINCGTGLSSDLSQAREVNNSGVAGVPILNQVVPHSDFVADCQSKLSGRRAWSIPLAAIGALAAGGAMLVGGRSVAIVDRAP